MQRKAEKPPKNHHNNQSTTTAKENHLQSNKKRIMRESTPKAIGKRKQARRQRRTDKHKNKGHALLALMVLCNIKPAPVAALLEVCFPCIHTSPCPSSSRPQRYTQRKTQKQPRYGFLLPLWGKVPLAQRNALSGLVWHKKSEVCKNLAPVYTIKKQGLHYRAPAFRYSFISFST